MVSVSLNGTTINDVVLDERITVRVGRRNVLQEGEPGSAALTLWLTEWVPIGYGDRITITEGSAVRFDGKISDVPNTWWEEDPDGSDAWILGMSIQAVGPLARWGRDRVGDIPWPAETVYDRAQRMSSLVGAPLIVQGGRDLQVIGRDVDSRPAIDVLEELAEDASGWLYDHAGITYLQSLDARWQGDPQERWDDQTTTWDAWEGTWDEQDERSPQVPGEIMLPPDAVLFAPALEQSSRIANDVTVCYGPKDPDTGDQVAVNWTDADSIASHERQAVKVVTRLANRQDADTRAHLVLERAAWPQWNIPDVEVACELLDPATLAILDTLLPGARCQVTNIPQPGPFEVFDACIEGWVETWERAQDSDDMLRTFELHLSDVRWSFAVLTWDGIVPDTLTWDQIDPDAAWDDMITAADLQEV